MSTHYMHKVWLPMYLGGGAAEKVIDDDDKEVNALMSMCNCAVIRRSCRLPGLHPQPRPADSLHRHLQPQKLLHPQLPPGLRRPPTAALWHQAPGGDRDGRRRGRRPRVRGPDAGGRGDGERRGRRGRLGRRHAALPGAHPRAVPPAAAGTLRVCRGEWSTIAIQPTLWSRVMRRHRLSVTHSAPSPPPSGA